MTMTELEKMIDEMAEEKAIEIKNDETDEFEDLVYHEVIKILDRSASSLWAADKETDRLMHKANVTSAIRILKYWDTIEEN